MAKLSLDEWKLEQVRFTIFPAPGEMLRSLEWWNFVTGLVPDEVTSSAKRGSALVKSRMGDNSLMLRLEADRIDWVLEGIDDLTNPELRSVGTIPEALAIFDPIILKWLTATDIPPITRAAFGAGVHHEVENRVAGYSLLMSEYIPVSVSPNSSDLSFQTNPPTVDSGLSIAGLKLNRLSRWGIAAFGIFQLAIAEEAAEMQRQQAQHHAMRIDLDVNTVPTFRGIIPAENLEFLYKELRDYGTGIIRNGVKGQQ